jgi:putative ABC transport system permease protein
VFRLAVANLIQNKTRLLISVGGIALALTLVLFFGAIFHGAQGRLTVYIDNAGADVWVSQDGVRTMHMSESALPVSVVEQVKAVPGVEQAVPILYTEGMIQANGKENIAYVFGVPPDASMGGPWHIVEGASAPGPGQIIIDHAIASQMGVRIGDQVTAVGQQMTVVGLTSGTSSLVSAVSFVRFDDFAHARGQGQVVSFVLVKVGPGETAGAVAARIGDQVSGVTVQTREEFAAQERKLVTDMSADIINIMNTAGYLTGLAVVALTIYIATVSRRREYGVLKAIGVRNSRLYQVVVLQGLLSVGMGLIAGLGLTFLLAAIIPRFNELIILSVSGSSLLQVTAVSAAIAVIASLLPARQLAGLEPVTIIRKGG